MFDAITNMMDGIIAAINQIAEIFSDIYTNLLSFNTLLTDNITLMESMTTGIDAGTLDTGGLAWLDFIATFHYVVGDGIYYLMFVFIVFGLSVTIFQIVYMIYNHIPIGSIIGGLKGLFFS